MPEQKPGVISRLISSFMRLFFRLLYHSFSWSYDFVSSAVSMGRWNNWIQSAVQLLPGPRVLELGYGPGHLQGYLHAKNLASFGLDESWQMARQSHRRLAREKYTPRLARGLAQHLPFASHSFHNVVATFPTLYITDPETLSEIRRVLLPNGRLVVLSLAWITGRSLRERFLQNIFRVTNEVPPEDLDLQSFLQPYLEAGFQAKLRFVEMRGSRLLFILATNPAADVISQ